MKNFIINEFMNVIPFGKTFDAFTFMLMITPS